MLQRLPPWVREWGGLVAWRLLLRRMAFVLPTAAIIAGIVATFWHNYAVGWTAVAAIGTIGVVCVALLADWFRTVLFPPRLELQLDRRLLSCPAEIGERENGRVFETPAWWLGLRVQNRRRWRPAKGCRVVLVDIHTVLPAGQWERRGMTVACPLQWAVLDTDPPAGPIQVTVGSEPEAVNLLRMGYILSAKQVLRLRDAKLRGGPPGKPPLALYLTLANWTFNFRSTIRPGETVRVALQVRADDVIPHGHFVYQISWDGEWPESQAEFWEHVDVKPMSES